MPYKDPDKAREKARERYEKNKEKIKEKNKEKNNEKKQDYLANLKQHAYDSITSGNIVDQNTWDVWCNQIKRSAANHPYSDDFTNDVIFEMMLQGCFYCGDVATTIDRNDSKLDHTPENCVGSCVGCNKSKGTADPDTFIRKAYYRARGEYYDDDINIWFVHKNKPRMNDCNKKVPFELTTSDWGKLVVGECAYCRRSPTTWFGVDRIDPPLGYVLENTVSCCFDCNLDKLDDDVDTMTLRNEQIARRMCAGELVINNHHKVILHRGKQPSSTSICARGKMYENMSAASDALGKNYNYVSECIRDGRHSDEIFVITKEFYEEYKDSEMYITKNMFVAFDHYIKNR